MVQNKKTVLDEIKVIRDDLYDGLPAGDVDAFQLIKVIKAHIERLDELIEQQCSTEEKMKKTSDEIIQEISEVLAETDGEFIETIANQVLSHKIKYVEDSVFELSEETKEKREIKCRELCEVCNNYEVQWILKDAYNNKVDYHVCTICLGALVDCRLSVAQFRNLIENGHTALEFLLHGDFYDEEGNALQPCTCSRCI